MVPLRASLAMFDAAGMPALRQKSERLTSYLLYLLDQLQPKPFELLTPLAALRGNQLSLMMNDHPPVPAAALSSAGVVVDFREPNVIRVAPAPLYNTYHEVWRFAYILGRVFSAAGRG